MQKRIRYNAAFEEYDMELEGEYIGSRSTYEEAEADLDAAAYEQARILTAQVADEAAERPAIIVAERDRCIVVEADGREWVYALEVDGACRAAQRIAALEQAGYRLEAA